MNIIPQIKLNTKFFLVLLFILIIPSYVSLIRPGFYSMQDDLQAFRLNQMDKCFQDLQIPCRWVPDAGFGYGYPLFNYYSPSIFYLGEIFHLLGMQIIDVVKLLFVLGFIFSAVTMFLFLKTLLGNFPALVGSLLYTYAPFRAQEVYVRGSINEFWGFVFFPLIFWSIYQLIKTNNFKYCLYFGLSLGGLLLTHNLMSIIFLPVAAVWAIYNLILEKKFKPLRLLIFSGLIGIGLSAFFILPVIFERQYAHVETLLGGYFDYRQHFVAINQLFISNYFEYGSSFFGNEDTVNMSLGQLHWILAIFAVIFAVGFRKRNKKELLLVVFFFLTCLSAVFLMHQRSSFIWSKITILSWLQFPWRFLAITTFLLSVLDAFLVFYILKISRKWGIVIAISVIIALFILHGTFFRPKDWYPLTDQEKFSGKSWDIQLTTSIFDYLPIYAKLPPPSKAPDLPEVLEGKVEFKNYQKGSDFQTAQLNAFKESAVIRVPLYDFPGMKVTVDDNVVNHTNSDCRNEPFCMGLITFQVPKGEHNFYVKLTNTPVRTIGNSLTILTVIVLLSILYIKNLRIIK